MTQLNTIGIDLAKNIYSNFRFIALESSVAVQGTALCGHPHIVDSRKRQPC